jgi:hypothetical protein
VIYALDTNVLVDALRLSPELDRLNAFLGWALPSTVLSSIVAAAWWRHPPRHGIGRERSSGGSDLRV